MDGISVGSRHVDHGINPSHISMLNSLPHSEQTFFAQKELTFERKFGLSCSYSKNAFCHETYVEWKCTIVLHSKDMFYISTFPVYYNRHKTILDSNFLQGYTAIGNLLLPKYTIFIRSYAHSAEIGMLARNAKMCSGFDKDINIR